MAKAVVLLSGGLDSMLAAKVVLEQGVHVEAINFYTGFCHVGHNSSIRKNSTEQAKRNDILWVANELGIKLHIIDVVKEYMQVLSNPKYGYGKNLNPCLDCKIFMVNKANQWILENKFDFIITGEVIGQRLKSQLKHSMLTVQKKSLAEDKLLRPLCAKLLEPTMPERNGWVNRDKLYDFNGRNRKPQIELAKQYNFIEYSQPAGGCCTLTDPNYSKRLLDLWDHNKNKNYVLDDIVLLKLGRHFRVEPNNLKLIVSRDEGETKFLTAYSKNFIYLISNNYNGAIALLDPKANMEEIIISSQILGRFTKGRDLSSIDVNIVYPNKESKTISVKPFQTNQILKEWYV